MTGGIDDEGVLECSSGDGAPQRRLGVGRVARSSGMNRTQLDLDPLRGPGGGEHRYGELYILHWDNGILRSTRVWPCETIRPLKAVRDGKGGGARTTAQGEGK